MTIQADNQGKLECSFSIPEGIPSGRKRVTVVGSGGSFGEAHFEGKGELWQENRHTTTTVTTTTHTSTTNYYRTNVGLGWWGWYYYPYCWYYNPWYYRWYWGWYGCGWYDPLAQTFRLAESRQIAGIELFVRAKGDTPITVQLRTTQNGFPSDNLLAVSAKQPDQVQVGQWNTWEFPEPVLLNAEEEYCFVVLCNDENAELAIAEMGKWDNTAGKWVTAQPYQVGVLLSSSNASSWTVHQDRDLAFRLLSPTYAATSKKITLGTAQLADATDIALAAEQFLSSSACRVEYEAVLPDGRKLQLAPGVGVQLDAPVTGAVTISATLKGDASTTPIVAPGCQLVHGQVQESATYVSRAIEAGTNSKAVLIVDAKVPTGATLAAHWKGVDAGDTWQAFPAPSSKALTVDWAELTYSQTGINEAMIQIRLTLTGSTTSRPVVSNLRLYTT